MPGRNIEIKARLADRPRVLAALAALGATDCGVETQHDIFWKGGRGRLKLRRSSRDGAHLIHYERADAPEVRLSRYERIPVEDPEGLVRVLDAWLERGAEVRKVRHLFLVDNIRVHLDDVEGLGAFLELEAVLGPGHPQDDCERDTVRLLERCGIPPADRWSVAYVDALTAGPPEPTMPDMVDVESAPGPVPVPAAIAAPLAPWTAALQAAAGPAFVSLYVYGSALTARYDPRTSDVNLLVVVEDLPLERLASLGDAVRTCARQSKLRVTPLVLTVAQVRGSSDVFPLEFLDFTRRRSLLAGTDALAAIVVGRGNLRHQCEYELRAKLVGLRQAFLLAGAESGVAHRLLVRSGGGLSAVLRYLLVLHGQEPPEAGEDIGREVGRVFAVDGEALAAPFTARRAERVPDEATARRSFASHLRALEQLVAAVDALPIS